MFGLVYIVVEVCALTFGGVKQGNQLTGFSDYRQKVPKRWMKREYDLPVRVTQLPGKVRLRQGHTPQDLSLGGSLSRSPLAFDYVLLPSLVGVDAEILNYP